MKQINKDMIIADIIAVDRGVVPFLLEAGLHCIGCPASQGETLAEASLVHGMETDSLVERINKYLATLA